MVSGIVANIVANNMGLNHDQVKHILIHTAVKDVTDTRPDGTVINNLPRVQVSCDMYWGHRELNVRYQ